MAGFQKIRTFRNESRSERSVRGNNRFRLNWIFYLVLAVPGCISIAQQECNWPCFHGADRANKSTETGLLEKWSETGPELIWTISGLGEMGRLAAFDYKTGKEIWNVELRDKFDAEIPEYGYSESVIIDGDRLYCNPGGKKGYTVCLDRKNGNLIWANTEIQEPVGNNSSIIFEHGGYRQIAGVTSKSIYGLDTKTGKLLWFMEYENSRENNIADPIFHDGYIFASSGYGKGSILIKLKVSGSKIIPETVWQTELMDNLHGGVILHDGYLYGSGHNARGWFSLDFATGKEMWKSDGIGSVTYADGMLYCLDERGIMTLVTATPEKYTAVSTFEVPSGGKGMHWAHPVVCEGRLYIRHTDKLFVYDVKGN